MPDFPRYNSKAQITTQQPSVQAAAGTEGQILEKTAQVASNASERAHKWSNTVDTIQKTTSSANFKSGMLDITQRAQADPNYNNSDQYYKEIEKLKMDNLKGFSSKTAQTQAAIEFGYEAKVGQAKIQNLYKKKMIDVGQVSALRMIDAEVGNPTDNSFGNIKKILNDQVASGIFSHEQAYQKYKEAAKNIGAFAVANDPADQ